MRIEELKQIDSNDKYPGIYALYNKENYKIYVGSSINIYDRVYGDHVNLLSKKKHYNKYLQYAYDKDYESFIFVILEKVEDKNNLLEREQYWMDSFLAAKNDYGYNLTPTAGSMLGFKHSAESRKLIGEVQKGRKQSPETIKKRSESLKGEKCYWFGKKFSKSHIERLKESRKNFSHTEESKKKISEAGKGRKRSVESIRKTSLAKAIPIVQLTLENILIREWESASLASKELNISRGNIGQCCRETRNQASGFKWMYKEDYEKYINEKTDLPQRNNKNKRAIVQLSIDGYFIKEWESMSSARQSLNLNDCTGISMCCRGKRNKAHGFKWAYKIDYEVTHDTRAS